MKVGSSPGRFRPLYLPRKANLELNDALDAQTVVVSRFNYESEGHLVSPTGSDSGFHKVARNFSVWSRVAWLLI